jgi:ketosteroid isomerase-like protein
LVSPDEVDAEIESTRVRLSNAMRRGDAKAMASLCHKGAQLLPPNRDFVEGREAIESFWREGLENGFAYLKLTARQLERVDGAAIEVGRYRVYGPDGNMVDHGKYLVIWKREGSGWKLNRGAWNSSRRIVSG